MHQFIRGSVSASPLEGKTLQAQLSMSFNPSSLASAHFLSITRSFALRLRGLEAISVSEAVTGFRVTNLATAFLSYPYSSSGSASASVNICQNKTCSQDHNTFYRTSPAHPESRICYRRMLAAPALASAVRQQSGKHALRCGPPGCGS